MYCISQNSYEELDHVVSSVFPSFSLADPCALPHKLKSDALTVEGKVFSLRSCSV